MRRAGRRPALPDGFVWLDVAGARIAVDRDLRGALERAGLGEPAGIARRLAAGAVAGGRAPLAVVDLAGGPRIALRPVRRGGWLGAWLGGALFDPDRPLRELVATARLHAAGAPVPRPVLAAAWRRGASWRAAVATAFLEDTVDGATFLAAAAPSPRLQRRAAAAAGAAVRRFHDAGGRHADLHVANLVVRAQPAPPAVWLVDLDGARAAAPPPPARRMAELMRLYRSLRKRRLLAAAGGIRACAAFLGAYAAGDRALRRALLARLPAERRRLARHALLYRA